MQSSGADIAFSEGEDDLLSYGLIPFDRSWYSISVSNYVAFGKINKIFVLCDRFASLLGDCLISSVQMTQIGSLSLICSKADERFRGSLAIVGEIFYAPADGTLWDGLLLIKLSKSLPDQTSFSFLSTLLSEAAPDASVLAIHSAEGVTSANESQIMSNISIDEPNKCKYHYFKPGTFITGFPAAISNCCNCRSISYRLFLVPLHRTEPIETARILQVLSKEVVAPNLGVSNDMIDPWCHREILNKWLSKLQAADAMAHLYT